MYFIIIPYNNLQNKRKHTQNHELSVRGDFVKYCFNRLSCRKTIEKYKKVKELVLIISIIALSLSLLFSIKKGKRHCLPLFC